MTAFAAPALAAALLAPAPHGAAPDEAAALLFETYAVGDLTGGDADALRTLAEAIVLETGRDRWATFGGPGVVWPNAATDRLIVLQTRANHERIVGFLTARRAAPVPAPPVPAPRADPRDVVPPQIDTSMLLIEIPNAPAPPALRAALDLPPANGMTVFADEAAVDRLLAAAAKRYGVRVLSRPRVATLSGQEGTIQTGGAASGVMTVKYTGTIEGDAVRVRAAAALGAGTSISLLTGEDLVPAGATALLTNAAPDGPFRLLFLTPRAVGGSSAGE